MNQAGIEYLITADKNLSYPQNYRKWNVKLTVPDTFDNQYDAVLPFVEKIEKLFDSGTPKNYILLEP